MKRKRGPAPHARKSRLKPKPKPKEVESFDESEEWNGVSGEEDSFEGFSNDEEEQDQPIVQEDDDGAAGPVNGSAIHTKKRGKKAAPTQEELMELFFRSSSFQSNLFKLQVDELLSEVRVKYDKMDKVETVLHKLKEILTSLPESEEKLVCIYFS
jgi:U3 small nucleolar RNA-associated protein 22